MGFVQRSTCRMATIAVLALLFTAQGAADDSPEELGKTATALSLEGKWEEAAAAYSRLTEMQPSDPRQWTGLARAYRGLERFEEAISAYEKALSLNPTLAPALAGMAITLELQDDVDQAFEYLSRAAQQGISKTMLEQNPAFGGLREHGQFDDVLKVADRVSSPCLHEDPYDDFDFWIGEWDVQVQGQKLAENIITKEMNGCIIRERYHNQTGFKGESINYYDPETGKWKQNWVSATGGVTRYAGGLKEDGVMYMEGANTSASGTTRQARVTWTRMPEGQVHHVIEHSTDQGKTWQVAFDATYVKSDRRN